MLILRNLTLSFGNQTVFDHISETIQQSERIGLFGLNGSGKSTLLKAIAGMQKLDGGTISCARGKTIAYLPQEVTLISEASILDETMTTFTVLAAIQKRIEELEAIIAINPHAEHELETYSDLCMERAALEPEKKRAAAIQMLTGLGFSEAQLNTSVQTLSVGWKMRIVLAKLLLQEADFYLFDEPTNHLDIVAKEWFLQFLESAPFGFLLVCHEKRFLNRLCTHILEIERGKGTRYTGTYDEYVVQKTENRERIYAAYEQQKKEIARQQATISRFKAGTKSRMAQSMEKRLSKVDRIELPPDSRIMAFPLPPITKSGKTALIVKNVSYRFGERTIFKNVSFELERGAKAAIVAPNGVGKTTLLNVISGRLPLQTGSVELGYQVTTALFDQDQTRSLDLKKSIFDNVAMVAAHASEQTIRGMLGAFLFSGETIQKPAGVLSGGERNRLGMVKTLLQNANLLLLDEPTNHLDIPSKDVLLDALQRYTGTMLFVSHDHDFVNNLATHIIVLSEDGATLYHGTYDEYLYQKQMVGKLSAQPTSTHNDDTLKKTTSEKPAENDFEHRKKIASIEKTISRLELDITKIGESFADLEYGTAEFDAAMKKLHTLKEQLAGQVAAWEKLHE